MKTTNRREFGRYCAGLVATLVVARPGATMADEAAHVDPENPQAKALGYIHDAAAVDTNKFTNFKAGSHCANCQLYLGGEEWGGCGIFPGKQVKASGWCSAWAKKAS